MQNTSLSQRITVFGRTLWHPDTVRTNSDTSLLRLIALITMAVDHFGKMCFPQVPQMRLIGRLAFPLFAYGVAAGAVYTKNPAKYLSRIVLMALLCQPLYAIGLAHENAAMYAVPFFKNPLGAAWAFYSNSWQKPSILLSLSLGLLLILCIRHRQWVPAVGVYILCERMSAKLDYGVEGVRLMLLFYALCAHPKLAFIAWGAYMIHWSRGWGYTMLGMQFGMRIFALPAVLLCALPMQRRFTLPRWLIYGFYPAHLAVLALVA